MPRLALACLLAATLTTPTTPAAAAVAPGCTSSRPTWVGGTFRGSDGRAINAHIGIVLSDGTRAVLEDGTPKPPEEGYSLIQRFNPTVPATGTTDPGAVREWGVCVAANVARSFLEIYPKRPHTGSQETQPTDYSRYGLGVYYFLPVTAGARLNVLLRTPVIYQQGGNTGGMQGYITRGDRPIAPQYITRVRAFTHQRGSACGIEGMAAIANRLQTGSSGRTYYLVDYLAAGQCGAAYQTYSLRVTCGPPACGSSPVLIVKKVNVVRGRWPRVDIRF